MLKGLNLKSGFTRLYIALSLIWFSFFIYQSNKYLGYKWDSKVVNITNSERDKSKHKNSVCSSWNDETLEKLKNPHNMKKLKGSHQKWFQKDTEKIEFSYTTDYTYHSNWKNYVCQFTFKKPRPFKDRITSGTKSYFYYSLFPIPTYLLIIFVVKGFRRNVK